MFRATYRYRHFTSVHELALVAFEPRGACALATSARAVPFRPAVYTRATVGGTLRTGPTGMASAYAVRAFAVIRTRVRSAQAVVEMVGGAVVAVPFPEAFRQ